MANLSGQNPQNIRLSTKGGLEVALLNYGASLKSIRVPEDGTSAADLWGMESESPAYNVVDGIVYFDWLDSNAPLPRDVPQSLKTLTEPVSFNNPEALTLPVTFVAYVARVKLLKNGPLTLPGKTPRPVTGQSEPWIVITMPTVRIRRS